MDKLTVDKVVVDRSDNMPSLGLQSPVRGNVTATREELLALRDAKGNVKLDMLPGSKLNLEPGGIGKNLWKMEITGVNKRSPIGGMDNRNGSHSFWPIDGKKGSDVITVKFIPPPNVKCLPEVAKIHFKVVDEGSVSPIDKKRAEEIRKAWEGHLMVCEHRPAYSPIKPQLPASYQELKFKDEIVLQKSDAEVVGLRIAKNTAGDLLYLIYKRDIGKLTVTAPGFRDSTVYLQCGWVDPKAATPR